MATRGNFDELALSLFQQMGWLDPAEQHTGWLRLQLERTLPMIPIMFLHGLDSSSQSEKARRLRQCVPRIVTPDFSGSLAERMEQLQPLLAKEPVWILIGSSFGGLMAARQAIAHPQQVERLVLLAPALHREEYIPPSTPLSVPTLWIHGYEDAVVPLETVRRVLTRDFSNLTHQLVDDDHRLTVTAPRLDWMNLLWPAQASARVD